LSGRSGLRDRSGRLGSRLRNVSGGRLLDGCSEGGNWRRSGGGGDDGGNDRRRSGLTCRGHCLGRLRNRL